MNSKPIQVFISYAHEDAGQREHLEKHLAPLMQRAALETWHAGLVAPGMEVRKQVFENLERADLILLLISAAYLAQNLHSDSEMTRSLDMIAIRKATVIPIILKPASWQQTKLSRLQVLPRGHKPVTSHSDLEEAFSNIASELSEVIKEIQHQNEMDLSVEVERLREENEKLGRQLANLKKNQKQPGSGVSDIGAAELDHFASIRKSYRIVYKHQRRLFDHLAVISDELTATGLPFCRWDPMYSSRPAKSPSEFFRRTYWAWDFLPSYALRLIWQYNFQKVLVEVVSDTGYRAKRTEPDPVDFSPILESKCQLWFNLYSSNTPDVDWNAAWQLWSKDENIYDGYDHAIYLESNGAKCVYRYVEIDMVELGDPQILGAWMNENILSWLRKQRPVNLNL